MNKSATQKIREWLHVEQVNKAVEVHVAKQNITVAVTPAKLMTLLMPHGAVLLIPPGGIEPLPKTPGNNDVCNAMGAHWLEPSLC